jgi:hypothetical protein
MRPTRDDFLATQWSASRASTDPCPGRTEALPRLTGVPRVVRELRYHESSRQLIGIALIALLSYAGHPT